MADISCALSTYYKVLIRILRGISNPASSGFAAHPYPS
jgi:hypothetical protein